MQTITLKACGSTKAFASMCLAGVAQAMFNNLLGNHLAIDSKPLEAWIQQMGHLIKL